MRFAGQQFRQGRMGMPAFKAQSGSIADASYRPQVQGLEQSRAAMPEQKASSFSKTGEPNHSKAPFVISDFKA